jgi:serine/threonine-protein phosphatase 5
LRHSKDQFTRELTISDVQVSEGDVLNVIGDIHGQFSDMLRIFEQNGNPSLENKYIFNGDLVDRGPDSVECVLALFLIKIACPRCLYITRGNHESYTCGDGTFKTESVAKMEHYNEFSSFFDDCHSVFVHLPLGYVINDKYFVCHGGLPDNFNLQFFRNAPKPNYDLFQLQDVMALLWNDPHEGSGMKPSKRGDSILAFGCDVTCSFLQRHNLVLLIRSHEYTSKGYFYCHDKRCLTVFSAPNYCGGSGVGVVMRIQGDLSYQIIPIRMDGFPPQYHLIRKEEMPREFNPPVDTTGRAPSPKQMIFPALSMPDDDFDDAEYAYLRSTDELDDLPPFAMPNPYSSDAKSAVDNSVEDRAVDERPTPSQPAKASDSSVKWNAKYYV